MKETSIAHEYELRLKQSVTRDQCSSSLGKSRDANNDLSDGYFCSHIKLMKDTYLPGRLSRKYSGGPEIPLDNIQIFCFLFLLFIKRISQYGVVGSGDEAAFPSVLGHSFNLDIIRLRPGLATRKQIVVMFSFLFTPSYLSCLSLSLI